MIVMSEKVKRIIINEGGLHKSFYENLDAGCWRFMIKYVPPLDIDRKENGDTGSFESIGDNVVEIPEYEINEIIDDKSMPVEERLENIKDLYYAVGMGYNILCDVELETGEIFRNVEFKKKIVSHT